MDKLKRRLSFNRTVLILVIIFLICSYCTSTAYASNTEYKLVYGKESNITYESSIIPDTIKSNSIVSNEYSNIKYKGKHFKYTFDCKGLDKWSYPGEKGDKINNTSMIQVDGIIGLPEKQKSSELYIFIHGRLGAVENSEFGFSYLVDAMASMGYRAISINAVGLYMSNINETQLFQEAILQLLNLASDGKLINTDNERPIYLDNIRDVNLLGHSRAGYNVFKIADKLMNNGYNVTHITSIAPLYFEKLDDEELHQIPITIILPEFDGDIVSLEGEDIYNDLIKSKYKANIDSYYLFGANHNYFNTAMTRDDSSNEDYNHVRNSIYSILPREEQMRFMIKLLMGNIGAGSSNSASISETVKFRDSVDANTDKFIKVTGGIIDNRELVQYIYKKYEPNYKTVLNSKSTVEELTSAEALKIESSKVYDYASISAFKTPGRLDNTYNYYEIESIGNVAFDISDSTANEVIIDVALDSTNYIPDLNESIPVIAVAITDTNGEITVKTFELTYIMGYCENVGGNQKRFSTYTPFEQLRFRLPKEMIIDSISIVNCSHKFNLVLKEIYIANTNELSRLDYTYM